jgi:hypothetical protein
MITSSPTDIRRIECTELSQQIRLMMIPFPPIIVSTGSSTLLSQAFISDHPASALVLINPPSSVDETRLFTQTTETSQDASQAISGKGFDYEPHFPILYLSTKTETPEHRLQAHAERGVGRGGKGVTFEVLDESRAPGGERGEGTRMELERWLDRCGY